MISEVLNLGTERDFFNVTIKLHRAMISFNKKENCTFQSGAVLLCVLPLLGKLFLSFWIFLSFRKLHLLAENEFAFSMSLSAVYVMNKVKIDQYFNVAITHLYILLFYPAKTLVIACRMFDTVKSDKLNNCSKLKV